MPEQAECQSAAGYHPGCHPAPHCRSIRL